METKIERRGEAVAASSLASMEIETEGAPSKPRFEALKAQEMSDGKVHFRRVHVPAHRFTPLKKHWMDIYTPIYEQMKIDIRMNLKRYFLRMECQQSKEIYGMLTDFTVYCLLKEPGCFKILSFPVPLRSRRVELKTRSDTPDVSNLQKSADFVHAYILGFDVADAVALLRLDDLYVDSFEIKDVKTLRNDHLARAQGRLAGKGGKTKFAIENATRTRIVIADTRIHILGSFLNIKIARDSLCSLILGSPAGKVYSKLRAVTARLAEIF